ncbi:MAG: TraB/GumN family protein [Bacteroidota bacterium]
MLKNHAIKALMALIVLTLGCTSGSSNDLNDALLWRIEGPGIETSYLFGTIHVMPRDQFVISEKVSAAVQECDQLVMELDLDDISLQMEVLKYAAMQDGTTLSSLVPENDFAKIDSVVTETLGVGLSSFQNFKPFVISTFLISRYIDGPPAAFELALMRVAEERGKEILGLETVAEQMAVFDRIPYEIQARELVKMVNDEDKIRSDYRDLLAQYQAEDLQAMYDLMVGYMSTEEERYELLDSRNEKWIPQILELAESKTSFFAVGAGHLAGDNGLIALLRAQGYSVTPL